MENNLKLSYDMLFHDGGSGTGEEEEKTLTLDEVETLLAEKEQKWQSRLEEECAAHKAEGIKQGKALGREEAEAEIEARFTPLTEMITNTDERIIEALETLQPQMASLVFDIVEKVLGIPFQHAELQQSVLDEIHGAIEVLDDALQIKVSLSAQDLEALAGSLETYKANDRIAFKVDESLQPGEYTIETKKEMIIKSYIKMINDFKDSISFGKADTIELD